MNYRLLLAGLLILIGLGLAFFPWGGSIPSKYSHGILTVGVGLEDIRLGESTLISVIDMVGNGTLGVTASDYGYAYELGYEKFGYVFFFKIPKECRENVGGIRELASIKNDINAFFSRYPACKNIPLSSIFVGPRFVGTNSFGQRIGDEFFSGSIVGKVDTSRQHDFSAAPNTLVSGSDSWESISFDSGIRIYYLPKKNGEKNQLIIQGMTLYKQDDTDEPTSLPISAN